MLPLVINYFKLYSTLVKFKPSLERHGGYLPTFLFLGVWERNGGYVPALFWERHGGYLPTFLLDVSATPPVIWITEL